MTSQAVKMKQLRQNLRFLDKAYEALSHSYTICKSIDISRTLSQDEDDDFEAYTSRFARFSDILLRKVFRTLDELEYENSGTIIDTTNRAHKRGLFDSVDAFGLMRDARNMIAHDYVDEKLQELQQLVLNFTPMLFDIFERTHQYCRHKKYE